MTHIQRLLLCVLSVSIVGCTKTNPQTKVEARHEAKTKLEAFQAKTGVVIISGFSNVGTVSGQYGSNVAVESKEFLDASTNKREYGITIEVAKGGEIRQENTSYIDYDEIESLLKGIDYVSKVESSVTKLDNFQADYHTKGDFGVSTFSTAKAKNLAAVMSGAIGPTTAYLSIEKLADLRGLIVNAKAKLDAIM